MVAERMAIDGVGSNLHPGNVAYRIYTGLRREDFERVVPV